MFLQKKKVKIAVLGCGAVGSFFLGALTECGADVVGIARSPQQDILSIEGIQIESNENIKIIAVSALDRLKYAVDIAIIATKAYNLEAILEPNHLFLSDSIIVCTQNGIGFEDVLYKYFPKEKCFFSVVMFAVTFFHPNIVQHVSGKGITISKPCGGRQDKSNMKNFLCTLKRFFYVEETNNIVGARHLKLILSTFQTIPALLGISHQEAYADIDMCRIALHIRHEAYSVFKSKGIVLADLAGYSVHRMRVSIETPFEESVSQFLYAMQNFSQRPFYGSMLQSLKSAKKTEIEFILNPIIDLADDLEYAVPFCRRISQMIHLVEKEERFLSRQEVLDRFNDLL